ncbi:hypothetical protein [Nibribacter koreensis]|uniref:HEAT repeat-containing protein n=1 Tax=Nibribacter koreensis TaxID=1084519 RepID=A0ABP8F6F0_9BACT
MTTAEYTALLTEGKPNAKGRTDEVALYILQNGQEELANLWPAVYDANFGIRARAAHVLEAVANQKLEWFLRYRAEILERVALPTLDPAYNFFIPSMLGLLHWADEDVAEVVERLECWLQNIDHQFVKVFCLQSLTDITRQQPWLKHETEELVRQHMAKGGKAINARGRMLLKTLAKIPTVN